VYKDTFAIPHTFNIYIFFNSERMNTQSQAQDGDVHHHRQGRGGNETKTEDAQASSARTIRERDDNSAIWSDATSLI
jgi:hypothetical protein